MLSFEDIAPSGLAFLVIEFRDQEQEEHADAAEAELVGLIGAIDAASYLLVAGVAHAAFCATLFAAK